MSSIRIISPGFLTAVQDLGRFGFAHLGVSAAGAADALSFRLGNMLVGNPEGAPALEMTLVGAEAEFEAACVIALAGADMTPVVDSQRIPMWTAIKTTPGQVLKCGATTLGIRTYMCISGGIDVPLVLGSASTHLATGLGGFCGRSISRRDMIPLKKTTSSGLFNPLRLNPEFSKHVLPQKVLRVTPGPQADLFTEESQALFCSSPFEVTRDSDRMGLRLTGHAITRKGGEPEILTEGVSLGAVQVTHSGDPIILFVDHQTTGGYPKIANIISADIHNVGQLRAGDHVTFKKVTFSEAHELLREQESLIRQRPLVSP